MMGEKSTLPKLGKYFLTILRLGSHRRYIESIKVKTNLFDALIILKFKSHVAII